MREGKRNQRLFWANEAVPRTRRLPVMFAIPINSGFVCPAFVCADSTVRRAFPPADSLRNPIFVPGLCHSIGERPTQTTFVSALHLDIEYEQAPLFLCSSSVHSQPVRLLYKSPNLPYQGRHDRQRQASPRSGRAVAAQDAASRRSPSSLLPSRHPHQ